MARHRGDDDARPRRSSRDLVAGQAHLLDMVVDRGVFFDEQVALRARRPQAGNSRSTRQSTRPQFSGKNSRNSEYNCAASVLLGASTMRRSAYPGDDIGHGIGLARPGDTQQRLPGRARPLCLRSTFADGGRAGRRRAGRAGGGGRGSRGLFDESRRRGAGILRIRHECRPIDSNMRLSMALTRIFFGERQASASHRSQTLII